MEPLKYGQKIGGKALPLEAKHWTCFQRRVFRFMQENFPNFIWLGSIYRRRAKDNPNAWSTHSWPDWIIGDLQPPSAEAGDTAYRRLRRRFPLRLKNVWHAPLHRPHHMHLERYRPLRSRFKTPPLPPYPVFDCKG